MRVSSEAFTEVGQRRKRLVRQTVQINKQIAHNTQTETTRGANPKDQRNAFQTDKLLNKKNRAEEQ